MMNFNSFTKGFRNSTPRLAKLKTPVTPALLSTKRQEVAGRVQGMIAALSGSGDLSRTDRRLLEIAKAVMFVLAGRV